METIKLNLTRKWRSQNFDQIIGQDLSIRILKNSLYLGHYFPVYLFSGQRGCGKTSAARVFASALNCEQLATFQQNPKKSSVPCLTCQSCKAMLDGKHPDFIEIDAASHTGVDNVRQIIESSSLLPLMGQKRVYLIDEVHMLSKAAFNALLKILEEPPLSALFILATTNPLKIIDTVRSRCFQLFFSPVSFESLITYLKQVCKKEEIAYHDDALELIIKQTDGSVRDALNLLEQVRFSSRVVSKEAVLSVLGHLGDEYLIKIINITLSAKPTDLLQLLKAVKIDQYSAEFVWQRLTELVRALLWLKHGVKQRQSLLSINLDDVVKQCSLQQLHDLLEDLYAHEQIMMRTTTQHALLEMVLLQVCQRNKKCSDSDGSSSAAQQQVVASLQDDNDFEEDEEKEENIEEDEDEEEEDIKYEGYMEQWESFVKSVEVLKDPLVTSIFSQGHLKSFDKKTAQLDITFVKDLLFFQDWLADTKHLWLPLLQGFFGKSIQLNTFFTLIRKVDATKTKIVPTSETAKIQIIQQPKPVSRKSAFGKRKPYQRASRYKRINGARSVDTIVDVSDKIVWKKAHLLLRYFPGTVTEVRESVHEK